MFREFHQSESELEDDKNDEEEETSDEDYVIDFSTISFDQ